MKTEDLKYAALDWAVAKALNIDPEGFHPSIEPCYTGPLLRKAHLGLQPNYATPTPNLRAWSATNAWGQPVSYGPTPEIALCRGIVKVLLGNSVRLPKKLQAEVYSEDAPA